MKKGIIILLSNIIVLFCSAQENFSMEKDRITQYEMDMTEYSADPEAEALIIFEKGDYRFVYSKSEGFLLKMTIHTKIKILSQAGEKYATFEVPIYQRDVRTMEYLQDVSGATYNYENDKLIKTEFKAGNNIFEEKINEKWVRKKFTFPNVKVGSIIEMKYTILTPFFVNMREWEFQKKDSSSA